MGHPCHYCQTENELGAQRCSGCGEPLVDPLAHAMDPEQLARAGAARKRTMRIVGITVGAVVVGGVAFLLVQSSRKEARTRSYVELQQQFLAHDKDAMGAFFKCALGTPMDVTNFQDNLAISSAMERAFVRRPREYTRELTAACGPSAATAAAKVKSLRERASGDYATAVDKYIEAANGLVVAAARTADNLKERIAAAEAEPRVLKAGNTYHLGARGKPGKDAVAYDRFLQCAVPDLDSKKDPLDVARTIYEACKGDPKYASKLVACASRLDGASEKPDGAMLRRFKRLGRGDNDVSAVADCFQRAKRAKGKDPFEPLARATVEYINARSGVHNVVAAVVKASK